MNSTIKYNPLNWQHCVTWSFDSWFYNEQSFKDLERGLAEEIQVMDKASPSKKQVYFSRDV